MNTNTKAGLVFILSVVSLLVGIAFNKEGLFGFAQYIFNLAFRSRQASLDVIITEAKP